MVALRALRNGIVFQFEELTTSNKGQFKETSAGGIYLGESFDESAKKARWCNVISVGDEVIDEGIVPGARILVDALKWTHGFTVEDEKFWKTDEDNVLAVDDSA